MVAAPIDDSLLRSGIIREAVADHALLHDAVRAAQAVSDALLGTIVGQVPAQWLSEAEEALVLGFLSARRDLLPELFLAARPRFPNLPVEET